jgi:hypothetical protein
MVDLVPPAWADALLSLGVGLGLAAAVGLRIFVPLLVLGCAAHFGGLPLAAGFEWIASGPALAAFAVATVLEVTAYYVPWLDNVLDVVAAPLAIFAGILVTVAAAADLPPLLRWAAAIIAGGGTAAAVQGLTSIVRLKSTATTIGAANPILATFELIGSIVTSLVAIVLPVLAILVVVSALLIVHRVARRIMRRRTVTGG